MRFKGISFLLILAIVFSRVPSNNSTAQPLQDMFELNDSTDDIKAPEYLALEEDWIDSVYNSMTDEQRIGQLFMIAAYSNKGKGHIENIASLVIKYNIGGLIFFQGGPVRQAKYTNYLQSKSKVPLLIAIDAEWGLAMRLDSTIKYPRQLVLGAVRDDKVVYSMGKAIASQCKRLGVHINLAPVIDVNTDPKNPVIGDRSFGELKENVARKGIAYMKGMAAEGVLACAKHFPGHGDTDTDSHKTLPVIKHNKKRLMDIELYPFKQLIDAGVGAIMAAHLYVEALDSTKNQASSLSKKIITDLLKTEMGFKGLVFSDALNMKGVSGYYKSGEIEVKAFQAGNDILLFPQKVATAVTAMKSAIESGEIDQSEVNKSVKKILKAKYWVGLHKNDTIDTKNLVADLNAPKYQYINYRILEGAITLSRNKYDLIPFRSIDTMSFASVSIGNGKTTKFQDDLSCFAEVTSFSIYNKASSDDYNKVFRKLKDFETVFVSIHKMSSYASRDYAIKLQTLGFLKKLNNETKVVVVIFGSPYSTKFFDDNDWLLTVYEETDLSQLMAAQLLFGAIDGKGILPVTGSKHFKAGSGIVVKGIGRLKYTMPEELGIKSSSLYRIDTILLQAIEDEVFPGCQVMMVKNGNIVLNRAYGYHTYKKKRPVKTNHLYDLASITKVSSTLIALMQLYDSTSIDLDSTLGDYLPDLEGTNKEDMIIRDILIHQSGLRDWIPFYFKPIKENDKKKTFVKKSQSGYTTQVANQMYIKDGYSDVIWKSIYKSKVRSRGKYVYSDLGFYFMKRLVEDTVHMPINEYVYNEFYRPLGLSYMCFNPLNKHSSSQVIPTEEDDYFRNQLVHGFVHDPGAAMLGGVAGHAGLFSNTGNLAVLFQMLLDDGEYAGVRYYSPGTVSYFSSKQVYNSRRGLGFDKTETDPDKVNVTCNAASALTFGHTGFTGTCVWVDPKYDLIFIFLSNRVHPTAVNTKLITNNIRPRIQTVMYRAIFNASD